MFAWLFVQSAQLRLLRLFSILDEDFAPNTKIQLYGQLWVGTGGLLGRGDFGPQISLFCISERFEGSRADMQISPTAARKAGRRRAPRTGGEARCFLKRNKCPHAGVDTNITIRWAWKHAPIRAHPDNYLPSRNAWEAPQLKAPLTRRFSRVL